MLTHTCSYTHHIHTHHTLILTPTPTLMLTPTPHTNAHTHMLIPTPHTLMLTPTPHPHREARSRWLMLSRTSGYRDICLEVSHCFMLSESAAGVGHVCLFTNCSPSQTPHTSKNSRHAQAVHNYPTRVLLNTCIHLHGNNLISK